LRTSRLLLQYELPHCVLRFGELQTPILCVCCKELTLLNFCTLTMIVSLSFLLENFGVPGRLTCALRSWQQANKSVKKFAIMRIVLPVVEVQV
jgi:hypothetical protein